MNFHCEEVKTKTGQSLIYFTQFSSPQLRSSLLLGQCSCDSYTAEHAHTNKIYHPQIKQPFYATSTPVWINFPAFVPTVLAVSNCVEHDGTSYAVLKHVEVEFCCGACRCDTGAQCWVHRVNVQAAHFGAKVLKRKTTRGGPCQVGLKFGIFWDSFPRPSGAMRKHSKTPCLGWEVPRFSEATERERQGDDLTCWQNSSMTVVKSWPWHRSTANCNLDCHIHLGCHIRRCWGWSGLQDLLLLRLIWTATLLLLRLIWTATLLLLRLIWTATLLLQREVFIRTSTVVTTTFNVATIGMHNSLNTVAKVLACLQHHVLIEDVVPLLKKI